MHVTIQTILDLVDGIAPFSLAEDWDNSGLQAGEMNWPADKVLVALDPSMEVIQAAVLWQANVVVTHHPLMIRPVKQIEFDKMPGRVVMACATNKISIVSAHTNLDKAENGLNDLFADIVGFKTLKPFLPHSPSETERMAGIGRQGELSDPLPLGELAGLIGKKLNCTGIRTAGEKQSVPRSAVVCTGSGGSLTSAFLKSDADVFITGDMKYHEARDIEQAGKLLIDVGHFASEHIAIALMVERLDRAAAQAGIELSVKGFEKETDPFTAV
ncbi:MAG: Nif3-like dinuclear metal center hexameric protein [Thermodesulfobacteriota bacterium]|nr:Nif3-like dinuclear metal center hexameric protein [Thermodesulfobacteriota bacterium]